MGLEVGTGVNANRHRVSFEYSKIRWCDSCENSINSQILLKLIDLCILKGWILRYVNYISKERKKCAQRQNTQDQRHHHCLRALCWGDVPCRWGEGWSGGCCGPVPPPPSPQASTRPCQLEASFLNSLTSKESFHREQRGQEDVGWGDSWTRDSTSAHPHTHSFSFTTVSPVRL